MKTRSLFVVVGSILLSVLALTLGALGDPLDTWTIQTNGISLTNNAHLNAVAYGNGLFVAVGNIIATSPDGTNWTAKPAQTPFNAFTNEMTSIVYGNGIFVACGTTVFGSTVMFYSSDGQHWTYGNVPSSVFVNNASQPLPAMRGVAYGNTAGGPIWVAMGPESVELISVDGTNWDVTTGGGNGIPAGLDIWGITYGNGYFVALPFSGGGQVYLSLGGEVWLPYSTGAGSVFMENIGYGNGLFVVLGELGYGVAGSTDAMHWVQSGNPQSLLSYSFPNNGLGFGNGQVVAVGNGPLIVSAPATNPLTWVTRFNPPFYQIENLGLVDATLNAVTYVNGLWVAVGAHAPSSPDELIGGPSGALVMTAGAKTPVIRIPIGGTITNLPPNWWKIIQLEGGAHALMVGDTGSVSVLINGVSYPQTTPTTNQLRGAAQAINRVVAVGANGAIITSLNGTNWTTAVSPTTNLLFDVASGNGLDVAVGAAGTILVSQDDTSWTMRPALGTNALTSIAFGNGEFEALSTNGSVYVSTNGTNWTANAPVIPGFAGKLTSVTFANGQFNATDLNGDVLFSTNGINWGLLLSASGSGTINSATLLNGTNLVLVGNGGSIQSVTFPVASTGTTADLNAIAYGGGLYVAVGSSGTIINSRDGSVWNNPSNYFGTQNSLNAIAYTNGIFCGVGDNGWVVSASDGDNWNSSSSGATVERLRAIAYAQSKFVAVGDNGTIITSSDTVNWTNQNSGSTATLTGITFAYGKFVVTTSDTATSLVSTDGIHWVTGGANLNDYVNAVTAGNGLFVSVDSDGTACTSYDGMTWTRQAYVDFNLASVAFEGGVFAAAGRNGSLLVSPDGTNWTLLQTPSQGQDFYGIVAGNSEFVCVGSGGIAVSASQGALAATPPNTAWRTVTSPSSATMVAAAFNGRVYSVLTSDTANCVVSTNGLLWTKGGSGLNDYQAGITSVFPNGTNNYFVAVDSSGNVTVSVDGVNWVSRAALNVGAYGIVYGGGTFVIAANNGSVFSSTDNSHWSGHHTGLTGDLYAITYANGQFVVVASDGTVATSPNGTTWTPRSSPTTDSLNAITCAKGLYVAVGDGETIMTSPDAVTWTLETNSPLSPNALLGIAYGNGEFMAVGDNGWTTRSADGTHWISSSSATVNRLRAIIFATGSFLAVGDDGTMIETPIPVPPQLPSITLQPGRGVVLHVLGTANSSYSIQVSTNLVDWAPLTGVTLNATNGTQLVDPVILQQGMPGRFYRATLSP